MSVVDVGFLKAEGARLLGTRVSQVRPDAAAVVEIIDLDAAAVRAMLASRTAPTA
jgi:hypothetical protein